MRRCRPRPARLDRPPSAADAGRAAPPGLHRRDLREKTTSPGCAPVGERLHVVAPFGKWRPRTFIAGLTSDELIAPWVIEGAMNGAAFATYVETQLAPLPAPGTVVILDNLGAHRNPRAAQALKAAGCWFLFLPPPDQVRGRLCSPDLNPIEQAFSKVKAHLRRIGARAFDQLIAAICDLFSPEECSNFFKHAGEGET